MTTPRLIHAVCTPLTETEALHRAGLEAHLDAVWASGASGILIGGTMGLMQLHREETYGDLVRHGVALSKGRGEILVGIGDTSLTRTLEKLRVAGETEVDGVVVLTPYFIKYTRRDLLDYFRAVADRSKKPVFVYYLPVLTGVQLDLAFVAELARHPNIRGIKCSCDYSWAHQLRTMVSADFRVIVAQPHLVPVMARAGVEENLDGIFAVVPRLTKRLVDACARQSWAEAEADQALLSEFLRLIADSYGIFPACEVILNQQGVPGHFCPAPIAPLNEQRRADLLAEPVVRKILAVA